jgi:hypothetical protein
VNQLEEWWIHGWGIYEKNGYSTEGYLLMGEESTGWIGFRRELPADGRWFRPAGSTCAKNLPKPHKCSSAKCFWHSNLKNASLS